MKITLITGGLGFIGSHTCIELLLEDAENCAVIVDNLANSSLEVFEAIKTLIGKENEKRLRFFCIDICDEKALEQVFELYRFDNVLHFAGVKSVSDSIRIPLKYYETNLVSTLNVLKMCEKYEVRNFVFSSKRIICQSANYSLSNTRIDISDPYEKTQYFIEQILCDYAITLPSMRIVTLRYFNSAEEYASEALRKNFSGSFNNLAHHTVRVALQNARFNSSERLKIDDVGIQDGNFISDYANVMDLTVAHLRALKYCEMSENSYEVFTVANLIHSSKPTIADSPCTITSHCRIDNAAPHTSAEKTRSKLNWKAMRNISEMCKDAYRNAVKKLD